MPHYMQLLVLLGPIRQFSIFAQALLLLLSIDVVKCSYNLFMSTKDNIFLFDLDGTLSPSRQRVGHDIAIDLRELSKYGTIGIVSGSDYNFINESIYFAK